MVGVVKSWREGRKGVMVSITNAKEFYDYDLREKNKGKFTVNCEGDEHP
jgi:hypothetical protein